jgi:hypothetical protein
VQYDLVFSDSRKELVKEVNRLIAEGWAPQGGVAITVVVAGEGLMRREAFIYAQAMIKPSQGEG